jgi:hypothetical protein
VQSAGVQPEQRAEQPDRQGGVDRHGERLALRTQPTDQRQDGDDDGEHGEVDAPPERLGPPAALVNVCCLSGGDTRSA